MFKFLIILFAVGGGMFFQRNPLLFGKRTGKSHAAFTVFKHYPQLDDELLPLADSVAGEFTAYRNHCLRVLTFTNYFLSESTRKKIPNALDLAAVALAYHDIALWTDHELDYLEPSKVRMDKALGDTYTPQEIKIMEEIILEHHKYTDFTGLSDAENDLINAVRKGDWTDASFGVVRFGMPAALLEAAYDQVPELGFHQILTNVLVRLSNGNLIKGTLELLKIFKW